MCDQLQSLWNKHFWVSAKKFFFGMLNKIAKESNK